MVLNGFLRASRTYLRPYVFLDMGPVFWYKVALRAARTLFGGPQGYTKRYRYVFRKEAKSWQEYVKLRVSAR